MRKCFNALSKKLLKSANDETLRDNSQNAKTDAKSNKYTNEEYHREQQQLLKKKKELL